MKAKVADRPDLLKRRIEDFFGYRSERLAARELIVSLAGDSHAWIFGGMIRDIGLFGCKGFTSDIDVVIASDRETLQCCLRRFEITDYTINKLGGIRFSYKNIDIDIWCLSDTWAFTQNLIPLEDEYSLLKTTLMTWDAVLYGLHNRKLISPRNYLDDLMDRRLELVLDHTPNEIGSLIKVLRTIYGKQVVTLGPKLCAFLQSVMHNYTVETLCRYESGHYKSNLINGLKITKLQYMLDNNAPGCELQLKQHQPHEQLPLHLINH
jgi:hypothetical protein